jgi:hypothetical protein
LVKVSTDARKMLNALKAKSGREASIEDVFIAEELAYTYFAKVVVGNINRMYNPNSKSNPGSMAFYVKPTRSLNKGRRKDIDEWIMTDEEKRVYWTICNQYLIDDFNHDQLKQLRDLCGKPYDMIQLGIKECGREDIRSIPYLFRVVEGLQAKEDHRKRQLEFLRGKFGTEDSAPVVERNRMEIANLMYSWEDTIQNVELQKKVDDLRGK